MQSAQRPFNDLPFLPPKLDFEAPDILKQLIKSHKSLAELKGFSELLPDNNLILNTVALREAKESSAIENIITTHDSLYKSLLMKDEDIDSATKEVLNYRRALWLGYDFVKTNKIITTNSIINIQKELERNDAGIRKLPGTNLKNEATNKTIYTPPEGETQILDLMTNLEKFMNTPDDGLDPLIKMTLIHYQFESIHPFYDGNGRTGRIINILYLISNELIHSPILYLSRYIIQNKKDYYRLLQEVRTKDLWQEWILYLLKGIEETSNNTLDLVRNIIDLMERTLEIVKTKNTKIYSKELIELLFSSVYIKITDLVDHDIASRNIASQYLKALVDLGLLTEQKIGRESLFINQPLYDLIKSS